MKNFKSIFISILFAGAFLFSACSPVSVKGETGSITISLPRSAAREVTEAAGDVMTAWKSFAEKSDFELRLYDEENALVAEPIILSNNKTHTFAGLQPGKYVVSVLGTVKISHEDMQAGNGEGVLYELMYPLGEEKDGENFLFSYLTGYGYCNVEVQTGKNAQAGIVIHPMNKVDNEYLPESVAGLLATKMTPDALFVKSTGDDTTADGSFEKPYKTLKTAILNVNAATIKDRENEIQNYAGYPIVVVGELTAEEGKPLLDLSDVELMEDLSVRIRGMGAGTVLKGNGNRVINYTGTSSLGLTLSNLTIKDGVASNGNGGGINFAGKGSLSLDDCTVIGNKTGNGTPVSSGQNGAGVYVGTGVYALDGYAYVHADITNCTFKENAAMGDAGAVYGNNCGVKIEGGLFEGNSSDRGGGAIYMSKGMLYMDSYYKDGSPVKFVNNKANGTDGTSYGGAIKVNGNYETNHSVSNAIFEGNEALGGGAICVQAGDIVVSDSQFTGNKATGTIGGGAIFIGGDGDATNNDCLCRFVELSQGSGVIFANNKADKGNGKAVYIKLYDKGPDNNCLNVEGYVNMKDDDTNLSNCNDIYSTGPQQIQITGSLTYDESELKSFIPVSCADTSSEVAIAIIKVTPEQNASIYNAIFYSVDVTRTAEYYNDGTNKTIVIKQ